MVEPTMPWPASAVRRRRGSQRVRSSDAVQVWWCQRRRFAADEDLNLTDDDESVSAAVPASAVRRRRGSQQHHLRQRDAHHRRDQRRRFAADEDLNSTTYANATLTTAATSVGGSPPTRISTVLPCLRGYAFQTSVGGSPPTRISTGGGESQVPVHAVPASAVRRRRGSQLFLLVEDAGGGGDQRRRFAADEDLNTSALAFSRIAASTSVGGSPPTRISTGSGGGGELVDGDNQRRRFAADEDLNHLRLTP